MDQEINYVEIEKKWQDKWAKDNAHTPNFDNLDDKFYCLTVASGDNIGHQ